MKIKLLLLGVLLISVMLRAEPPSHLVVHLTDGNQIEAALEQTPRLAFEDENLVLQVNGQTTKLPYEKVARLTFEQALSTAVENVEIAGCQVIVNNQMVQVNAEQSIGAVQIWNIHDTLLSTDKQVAIIDS